MKKSVRVIVTAAGVLVVILLLAALSRHFGLLLFRLPLGWVQYLARTIPNVTVNWSGIGMVILCSALAVAIGHSFCRWLYRSLAIVDIPGLPKVWPIRWTIALYASFWMLFVIVISASGLARTTSWFFDYQEPFYRARGNYWSEMMQVQKNIEVASLEAEKGVDGLRTYPLANDTSQLWENYNILWFTGPDKKLRGAIYYPRNAEGQRHVGFWVFGTAVRDGHYTMDKLPEFIRLFESEEPL